MRDKLKTKLFRLTLTLLLSFGLTTALLGAVNPEYPFLPCLLVCLLFSLALEIVFWSRRSSVVGGCALLLVLVFWLLGGGVTLLSDLLRAFTLYLNGVSGTLSLMSREASLLIAFCLTLICFFSTHAGSGSLAVIPLTVGALTVLWILDRPDLVVWLLPAAVATGTMMVLDRHQELSPARVLPWSVILMLLAFALTPKQGVTIPALKEKADEFRQALIDRMFFTEPRDVFSLASEGYYPQGYTQLGGPAQPSEKEVMQVSAPRDVYLRGVVMNEYDGRAWRNTLGGRRYLWDSPSMAAQRTRIFDQDLPSETLASSLSDVSDVSVRMLRDGASTLFVPQRVRAFRAGGELVPYFTNSSELFITRNLQAGDTWSVSAPLFRAGDPGLGTLTDAAAQSEDPNWQSVLDTYTVLPSHLEEVVWQLAAEITEGLSSPYEKAFAIQNYLSRNYRYTLDVAEQPADLDFVTNFLFNTREGYCTYFASAMTVLCRMEGLPARYVEGYLAEPDARGEALVTGKNAHAWTEVYFRGFGWLTFDATPRLNGSEDENPDSCAGSSEPTPSPEPEPEPTPTQTPEPESPEEGPEETPTPEPEDTPSPDPENSEPPDSADNPENSAPPEENPPAAPTDSAGGGLSWPLLLLLLILLLAAAAALRWVWTSPARKEKRLPDEEARFDLWMNDVLARLRALGYDRQTGETLMNFARRLEAEEGLPGSLGQLGECASLLHYGRVHALPTDTDLAKDASRALRSVMRGKSRLRYILSRIGFGKKSQVLMK